MNDEQETERGTPQVTKRRAALGYDARSERRTLRRAARHRKARTKFWLVACPAVVVIAAIVALLVLLGGSESESGAGTTSTTVAAGSANPADLLIVEQDGAIPVVVLIEMTDEGGLVLALPGITLLKTAEGFQTLAEIHASGEEEALEAALAGELGVSAETTVSVPWSELRGAMVAAQVVDPPATILTLGDGEAEQVAQAVMSFIEQSLSEGGADVWERLALQGEAARFRTDAEVAASSLSGGGWTAAALTGRVVQGDGFTYLEPDMDQLEILLAGPTEGAAITVEIENGTGMVGVVEQATAELEALGYTLVPAGNSADFPDAGETRITVAPDTAEAGTRAQIVLGVGTVTEDLTVEFGHVVVVLGADYVPPPSAATESTG